MSKPKPRLLQDLFHKHYQELRQFLVRRVGEQDAPDLLQDTCLRFMERADLEAVAHPRAFLYRTAANVAVDFSRRAWRSSSFTDAELEADWLVSELPEPEQATDGYWQFDRFSAALAEMPAIPRKAFILNKLHGMTHREIGEHLGISEKSVQRHVLKVLNHCLQRLSP